MTDAVRSALLADIDIPPDERARRLTTHIVETFGPATNSVIHYGSHAHSGGGSAGSNYDFFVVVDRYAPAYRHFVERASPRFGPRAPIVLAHILAPSIVALTLRAGADATRAKCAVLTPRHLLALCSPGAPDHFTKGRLFQQVRLTWTRSAADRTAVEEALLAARTGTLAWVWPWLPETFDAATYCRTLLTVSYNAEIRPENTDRAEQVFAAQREVIVPMYDALLRALAAHGVLRRTDGGYSFARRTSRWVRLHTALYFRRSKTRATLRWGKHMWLYDDWPDYLQAKVARHTGVVVKLTERERRWPVIFLWPKVIRYLRSRRVK